MNPRTLILRTAGTNCDIELAHAFTLAGAEAERVHLNRLIESPGLLQEYDLLGLPGGFSYGDDIAAGRIFANRVRYRLHEAVGEFVAAGKPVIGICNGFQLLVKAGLLPGVDPDQHADHPGPMEATGEKLEGGQVVTLADNAVPRFVDRWVGLVGEGEGRCVWTRGVERMELPIAHGEGRFVASDAVLDRLEQRGQVALRYAENPNGSARDIAGICDASGLVFGLMPHPERYLDVVNHPAWTRGGATEPTGLRLFVNAVEHVRGATPVR